jgi:NACHT domain
MPRYARTARFDQDTKRTICTEDTRTEVLETIHRWFRKEPLGSELCVQTDGNPQGQIFWLDSVAGTGKSTIAQTIAHHYHRTEQLAASFFCSRDDADCSDVNLLFPTIAYQLCFFHPTFRDYVSEALRKDPHLESSLTSMQLEKLIVEPLETVMRIQEFPPCLIVIDALDECKEDKATSTILLPLSVFASRISPVRFFVTSRPVPKVERGFRTTPLIDDTNMLALHCIPFNMSQKDIYVYLTDRLSVIARAFGLRSWPSSEALAVLVEQSSGLFIFAATVANFIEDQNASDPDEQLKICLSAPFTASSETSPHRHLDALYLAVLREAFPKISDGQRFRLRTVLGSIVLLFDPLSAEGLACLLGLEENIVRSTLHNLHSIAIVPDTGGGSVRLIHPSFHDFLIDINRCDDVNFVVDAGAQHTLLAERCLRVLQGLSPDICKIGDASLCNDEVADLSSRIATYIPSYVQYSCRHWASHLSDDYCNDETLGLLHSFCSTQLLNWLEVMSLLRELDSAVTALLSAHRVVKVRYLFRFF